MSKTILIVDDNEPTLKFLAGILEAAGYKTLLATDGDFALKLAKANKIDCAIVDQYMEPMNGFSFARHCQFHEYRFPMIMITANDNVDLLLQARKQGFSTVMMKPIDTDHLLQFLVRLCR